ncbi:MAG: dUTP diphosphatase, partial [Deferribacterales bacterium]
MLAIDIKIICEDGAIPPKYMSEGASGLDIFANESGVIRKGEIKLVSTGIFIEIPIGFEAQ